MNAEDLLQNTSARVLIVGHPGSGKTGSLAALANIGMKIRILAYDKIGNMSPLFKFVDRDKLKNIDIVPLDDKTTMDHQGNLDMSGSTAFVRGFKLMDHWKYKGAKGEDVDLGKTKDWGLDTVVVLDSLTAQGEAARRRAMQLTNRNYMNLTDRAWGLAIDEQKAFLSRLLSSANGFHVVVMSHLKMIGPQDIRKEDSDTTKKRKLEEAQLIGTRLYPTAVGNKYPQSFSGDGFTAVLHAKRTVQNGKEKRIFDLVPGEELDVKLPSLDLPRFLPIETGLLQVFEATTGGRETWGIGKTPVVTEEE
jgi:hypothetical protein